MKFHVARRAGLSLNSKKLTIKPQPKKLKPICEILSSVRPTLPFLYSSLGLLLLLSKFCFTLNPKFLISAKIPSPLLSITKKMQFFYL